MQILNKSECLIGYNIIRKDNDQNDQKSINLSILDCICDELVS